MRIAHVTCLYVPEHRGGAPQQCHQVAVGQHQIGHEVSVFTGVLKLDRPMLQVRRTLQDGMPVTRVVTTDAFRDDDKRNWCHPALEPIFQAFLQEQRPQLVHFHAIQSLGASLPGMASAAGARVVVTMHDLWWVCERQFCIDLTFKPCIPAVAPGSCACLRGARELSERRAYMAHALKNVDLILTPSSSLAERLRMSGVRGRIEVDPNGVRPGAGRRVNPTGGHQEPQVADRPLRLLYVGGEAKQKGIHVLAEALHDLRERGIATETDAYGVEPFSIAITRLLQGTGARLHRAYAPAAIDDVMSDHDVLVLPSVMYESSSRAVREALLRDLAVVATEVGGPEEVIQDGVNGLLVPPDDPQALADAILRLDKDRALMRRLAAAGPLGEVPTPEQQVAHLEELYGSLGPRQAPERPPAPSPRRVLFVAGIDGSPLHYRVHQKVEQLAIRGVESVLRRYSDPRLVSDLDHVDAVIVYRSPATRELVHFVREVHHRGLPIRFDVDDLIFDPELAERLPTIAHLPRTERQLWVEGVKRYRETLLECGAGIASTQEIARQMETLGVPARVHRNGVDTPLAVVSERARRARGSRLRRDDRFVLGYSSGTTTHDADLALVGGVLRDFLLEHPEARLVLGGPLQPPPSLDRVAGQIERLSFIGWERHPDRLSTFDLSLAPLIEGLFNESKSSIKWSEAALVDVPTLASASAPFGESVEHGRTGYLALDADAWREYLEEAITDRHRLGRMGRQARKAAYAQGSPWVLAENLLGILGEPIAEGKRAVGAEDPDVWPSEVQSSALEPAGLLPGLRASIEEKQRAPGPALRNHRVVFDIPLEAGPVARVDVLHATFLKPAGAPVSLALRSSAGTELRRVELEPEAISDNGWAAFTFEGPPVANVASAELSSSQACEAAPYLRPAGSHLVDGKRHSGGIVARSYHQPPIPPDFGPDPAPSRTARISRWAASVSLAGIAVRRAGYLLRTEGPIKGARRILGGVGRRLRPRLLLGR